MLFWRKKVKFNNIELERVILNKSESIYFLYNNTNKKDIYGIHTVVRNVPVSADGKKLMAKVRYVGIPDVVVYFILKITNVDSGYISSNSTVDININATIKNSKCKESKFELLPVYEERRYYICLIY